MPCCIQVIQRTVLASSICISTVNVSRADEIGPRLFLKQSDFTGSTYHLCLHATKCTESAKIGARLSKDGGRQYAVEFEKGICPCCFTSASPMSNIMWQVYDPLLIFLQATRMPKVLRKLQAGDRLRTGDKLESSNGLSTAALQDDGNFVVRRPCILLCHLCFTTCKCGEVLAYLVSPF